YSISYDTGVPMVQGGSLVPGSECVNCAISYTLPFPVQVYRQTFTTVQLNSDGFVSFTSRRVLDDNECLPFFDLGTAIAPYWTDLDMSPQRGPGLGIYTSVSGTAPNRILNIEWRACLYFSSRCESA